MNVEGGGALRSPARKARAGLLGAAVLLVAAFVLFQGPFGSGPDGAAPAPPARHGTRSLPEARLAPAAPVRLVIPAIRLRAPVVPIEMNADGVLDPPGDVSDVGWWRRSAKPGAHSGQTLLTGHTVSTGGGVMDHLGRLEVGDRVRVTSPRGTVIYETTRVRDYSTEEVAARARRLFGQDRRDGRLVLVTCTDYNGEEYESNTIVFAEPVGARRATHASSRTTSALAGH